ncbi:MAG: SUMF1/EgtB/PvdO family nonheme iron enzyme [Planctomycetaceae bacterium]
MKFKHCIALMALISACTSETWAGDLGATFQELPIGVRIARVIPSSPAATRVALAQPYKGYPPGTLIALEAGDLIVQINGRPIPNQAAFGVAVDGSPNQMQMRVANLQDGQSYSVNIQLGQNPRLGVNVRDFPRGVRVAQNYGHYPFTLMQQYRDKNGITHPAGTKVTLQQGDVVTHVNRVPVMSVPEINAQLSVPAAVPGAPPIDVQITNLIDGNSYSARLDLRGAPPLPPVPPLPPGPPQPGQFPPAGSFGGQTAMLFLPPTKMTLAWCPAGNLRMTAVGGGNEFNAQLTGFWMQTTEVTQDEFAAVTGKKPWEGRPDVRVDQAGYPATWIDWDGAMEFCRMLTQKELAAGRLRPGWKFTLPTEAQWEYACREGVAAPTEFCDTITAANLNDYSHNSTNSSQPMQVRGRMPSPKWQLCDMLGNVSEWCLDGYVPDSNRKGGPNPFEQSLDTQKVVKGGNYNASPYFCQSATRVNLQKLERNSQLGFRVALVKAP